MTFIIKIFHLQVNSFSGQMVRWSFWIQSEPTGQTLNLDEHMQIMPSWGASSFTPSSTQPILLRFVLSTH